MGRQGLPKKYAKMGFKKGWKAYKASKRGRSTKRTYRPKATKRRSHSRTASNPGRKKPWGIGRYINAFRNIDILSASAQGTLAHGGTTKYKIDDLKARYASGAYKYNTWKGVGTGLAQNIVKSKAGVYRGAGKGKILSAIMALSPEILALKDADPTKDIKGFNEARHHYQSGYSPWGDGWDITTSTVIGKRFWEDKMFNLGLGVIQKVVFNTNGPIKLNARLPKGVNF
jgi:hypothetical protein